MPRRLGQWEEVETAIFADIVAGRFQAGEKLPTEPDLCARYGVGRHSLRRAIAALVARGRLRVQQGSGTYVADKAMLRYQIGPVTRFSRNLLSQGLAPSGEIVKAETTTAAFEVAAALGLEPEAQVHHIVALGRADGVPISLSNSWHPAELFPGLLEARLAGRTLSEIYADHDLSDYQRRDTTITARSALRGEASLLACGGNHPVLVVHKTDIAPDGTPIGHSESIWVSERVQFSIGT